MKTRNSRSWKLSGLGSVVAIGLYRLVEHIDGEKGLKLISYKVGEKLKLAVLKGVN